MARTAEIFPSEHASHIPFQLSLIDSCPSREATTSQRQNQKKNGE
jgi:hypothetical protein